MAAHFFTLIYIKTNRFSNEQFCVGVLANLNGLPYFGYSKTKLNTALSYVNKNMSKSIKRSFNLLENDVNKIIKGEEPLSLFDKPYALKILEKLTLKKRGVVQYSNIYNLTKNVDFKKLYKKFVGVDWEISKLTTQKTDFSFKRRFFDFVANKKYETFTKKYKLQPTNYPLIYIPLTVDLFKCESYYLIFQTIDFSASLHNIQSNLNKFRLIRQSLNQKASSQGLSKGRYYLVYESQKDVNKRQLIQQVKNNALGFELIKLSEIGDKI